MYIADFKYTNPAGKIKLAFSYLLDGIGIMKMIFRVVLY